VVLFVGFNAIIGLGGEEVIHLGEERGEGRFVVARAVDDEDGSVGGGARVR